MPGGERRETCADHAPTLIRTLNTRALTANLNPLSLFPSTQVYRATLTTGETVAVKVQRPQVLETVSKDLYVLRRAAEVYQGLMDRFASQQRTDYVALLNEWAVGFYTELDFLNEVANQKKLKQLLLEEGITGVYVPEVYENLCTRRVIVSEWVQGRKLSEAPPEVLIHSYIYIYI